MSVRTIDYHTGGEPFRIVVDTPDLAGETVAEKRVVAITDPVVDGLRKLLCSEPRGHADMYGGFLVPPDDLGAHLGVLFWHKDGFSTACGHGTIALGAWAIRSGLVTPDPSGITDVVIDVPSGRVTARVHGSAERVRAVDFVNVASYVLVPAVRVPTSAGEVTAVMAYGGAIYAHVETAQIGRTVSPAHLPALIEISREIKAWLAGRPEEQHPDDARLSGTYGVIWYDDHGTDPQGRLQQTNVTVFADGEVDRSPCGSGTCSRLGVLAADGRVCAQTELVHTSIVGSTFTGRVIAETEILGRKAIIPQVTGTAYVTGEHTFLVDPDDDLVPGFQLR